LFPGIAVGEQLLPRGCAVTLLISPKEVDQRALQTAHGLQIATLPAVGLTRGESLAFLWGLMRSYRAARKLFAAVRPQGILAMGGFVSAGPVLAARRQGARAFLHESNSIPGRANRWLSRLVDCAFVGFPSATKGLRCSRMTVTGTPVRTQFTPREPRECRTALGFDPDRSVVLVMGGSQGAHGINDLVRRTLPGLARQEPGWQWLHLTGTRDLNELKQTYETLRLRALVRPFLDEMELALGAATAAISRAGASSLAELAAMRLPAVLVPYPAATGNHQFFNAQAYEQAGAARLLEQKKASVETLTEWLVELVRNASLRQKMQNALAQWEAPRAAEQIAETIVSALGIKPVESSGARPGGYEARSGPAQSFMTGLGGTVLPAMAQARAPVPRGELEPIPTHYPGRRT
jgi:UDP-N-acetylglucosamine--N-acetylmuramyl-(pentapeptide) pyrophosphoryl-undecaprenol N-acetylglucosamine transferase